MLSSSFTRVLSPKCLPILNSIVQNRSATRGVMRTIRDKLPKYKKDLGKLPPLTGLLVKQENFRDIHEAIELRKQKLDIYKQYIPSNTNTNYLEALFNENSNDIDKVLTIIDENLETLNSFLVAVSFEALDDLMVGRLCDPMTIAVSPEFKRLCQKTIYKLRFFEADEVLKLLKCLSNLSIPEDTLLVQGALQMARHHINDFNYEELVMLDTILRSFNERVETSKSLLIALKKVIIRLKPIRESEYTSLGESNNAQTIKR